MGDPLHKRIENGEFYGRAERDFDKDVNDKFAPVANGSTASHNRVGIFCIGL
jgi:hypothetical protein